MFDQGEFRLEERGYFYLVKVCCVFVYKLKCKKDYDKMD